MFGSIFLRILNWEASLSGNNPTRILESLNLHEGQVIAGIGSGGGYFTVQFARKVGKTGRVYAVDIEQDDLDFIRRRSEKEGLNNILFILAAGDELNLQESGVDLAFARTVFHHLSDPRKYFRSLQRFLKPDGKVAIIEHRHKPGLSFFGLFKHYTPPETIRTEMKKAGYFLTSSFDFLPWQSFSLL